MGVCDTTPPHYLPSHTFLIRRHFCSTSIIGSCNLIALGLRGQVPAAPQLEDHPQGGSLRGPALMRVKPVPRSPVITLTWLSYLLSQTLSSFSFLWRFVFWEVFFLLYLLLCKSQLCLQRSDSPHRVVTPTVKARLHLRVYSLTSRETGTFARPECLLIFSFSLSSGPAISSGNILS